MLTSAGGGGGRARTAHTAFARRPALPACIATKTAFAAPPLAPLGAAGRKQRERGALRAVTRPAARSGVASGGATGLRRRCGGDASPEGAVRARRGAGKRLGTRRTAAAGAPRP